MSYGGNPRVDVKAADLAYVFKRQRLSSISFGYSSSEWLSVMPVANACLLFGVFPRKGA
jgi:hypothetical protein